MRYRLAMVLVAVAGHSSSPLKYRRTHFVIVGLILLVNLSLRFVNLDHESVRPLDEVFHAIVARSLLLHPLTPTLNETPFFVTPATDWQNAHVWLHKPPLAMWQIAISYAALGVNTLALRLPSALLATASAWMTYLIARRLLDSTAALFALILQAFNPVLEMLVHGYVFSDHVDTALLFWSELSIYFLLRLARTGHRRDAMLCGAAQGAAFLAKTFPGLITMLLAVVASYLARHDQRWRGVTPANVGWILFSTVLIAGPWNLYAYLNWPEQYVAQTLGILHHLTRDVEGWAGPWDRLAVDYGWRAFHVFYPLVIAACILAASDVARRRDRSAAFALAWMLLVLLPNTFANSKPMTATLVGWPAVWLLLSRLIGQAWRGELRAIAGLLIALVGYALLSFQPMPVSGWGYVPGNPIAGVLLANWQPVAIGVTAGVIAISLPPIQIAIVGSRYIVAIATATLLLCPLGRSQPHGYVRDFWRVSQRHDVDPIEPGLVEIVKAFPPQAVFLIQTRTTLEDKLLQWKTGRDCWPIRAEQRTALTQQIIDGGGAAYLVTDERLNLPAVAAELPSGRRVYAVRSTNSHR